MHHVALVGDSVFDNLVYVSPGPDVQQQLTDALPQGWNVTLCAVDGAITDDVLEQLEALPDGVSNVVVSVGGNDALQNLHILSESVSSVAEGLELISEVVDEFQAAYRQMLKELSRLELPITVCTIYYPRFDDSKLQRVSLAALRLFNDAIIYEAVQSSTSVLDLRWIFDEPEDYANPIEPSVRGGNKLAIAISEMISAGYHEQPRVWVYGKS